MAQSLSHLRAGSAPDGLESPSRPDASRYVADIAAVLLKSVSRLTDRVIEELYRSEPAYREGSVPAEDLRRSVDANLTRHLEAMADATSAEALRTDAARATGQRRAEQGFPLEALLHAYRLGGRVIWQGFIEEAQARDSGGAEALLDGATLIWEVIDLQSAAVADSYRRTEMRLQRRSEFRAQSLFDALIEDAKGDGDLAAEAAAALALPESGPFVVVTAELGRDSSGALDQPAEAFHASGLRSAWRLRAEREIGIVALGASGVAKVVSVLEPMAGGRIGVGAQVQGLTEIALGYSFAETALSTIPRGRVGVALLDSRLPAALLVRAPDIAQRMRDRALGPVLALPADERAILLETLDAYFASECSASKTSARVFCHRNTVLNRIRRIEKLTKRSLSDPGDIVELTLALQAAALLP